MFHFTEKARVQENVSQFLDGIAVLSGVQPRFVSVTLRQLTMLAASKGPLMVSCDVVQNTAKELLYTSLKKKDTYSNNLATRTYIIDKLKAEICGLVTY